MGSPCGFHTKDCKLKVLTYEGDSMRRLLPALCCVALLLSSCKKVTLPPALDRDSFREETSVNLPKETEFLSSTTSTDNEGAIYTTLMLRMPKDAERLFPPTATDLDWTNANHKLTLNALSRLGIQLKDPKAPMRLRQMTSKTRGDGSLCFISDGNLVFVDCNFRLPRK